MLAEQRRAHILELLYENGYVRTGALQQQFDVSDVTLRSDLQELERRGRLLRIRGGAVISLTDVGKTTFDARLMRHKDAKQRIALAASQFIRGDSTVIFDAGTTLLALAHHMPSVNGLTVVTPALNTAQHLLDVDGVDVVILGGPVDKDTLSTVWPAAQPGESEWGAHITFLGAHGVDADLDIVEVSLQAAAAKRRLIVAGRRVIMLADSSKWAVNGRFKVSPITAIDVLITDAGLAPDIARKVSEAGIDLIVV
jgi:DeoR family transcriptional regulator of aga operon